MSSHLNIRNAMPGLVRLTFLIALIILSTTSHAQTVVSTINISNSAANSLTVNVTSPSDAGNTIDANTNYDVRYGLGNDIAVSSYVVSGTTYDSFLRPDTLVLNRRLTNDRLVNIWYTLQTINTASTPDQLDLDPTAATDADAIYLTGVLNAGYDNILVNEDDLASNSIEVETERVDVIWFQGIQTSTPANAVFPVIERGGNDNIAVAAITGLNADGTPSSYGTLVGIGETDWPGTGQTFTDYLILRREAAGTEPIPILNIGDIAGQADQTVQGMAVSFTTLGISANQSIFGYSIFAADVVNGYTSGSDLTTGAATVAGGVDLTDISTFPTNTLSSDSGLDLVAGVSAAVASDDNLIETIGPGGYKAALSTWLKANVDALITTSSDGSTVTDWQDRWLGDNDATTGLATPTYRSTSSAINFNPVVDFTTSETSLNIANNAEFNTATSYENKGINIVFRTGANVSNRQVLYEQGGTNRGIIFYIESSQLHVSSWNISSDGSGSPWNDGANINTVSTAVSAEVEYIVTLEQEGNSSETGTLTVYLNGTSVGALSNVVGLLFSDTDGIELGASDGTTQYDDGSSATTNDFEGEIPEFIYCNEPSAFTTAQRDRIESYLAIKYGITLNQSSPNDYENSDGTVVFDATNNASIGGYLEYNNDIAGIARDDASELDQTASRSENSGSVVTIDKGATFGTNDTWLVWGNDGAALTETALLTTPDTVDMRLNRVWRVAERNEAGSTSVSFDLTGLGLSTDASDFSLIIAGNSSNADFGSATVISGGTFNGNTITFTNVSFSDGEYFTLGTSYFECSPGGVESNLSLWLRADDGTSTTTPGSDVTTWTDQTGNNDATNGAATAPTYADSDINFNPALEFDGSQFIEGAAGFYTTAYYFVLKPDQDFNSTTTREIPIGFDVSSSGATNNVGGFFLGNVFESSFNEIAGHLVGFNGASRYAIAEVSASKTISADIPLIYGVRDNSGGGANSVFENGEIVSNGTTGSFLSATNEEYEIGNIEVPNAFSVNRFFDGSVAELISYSVRPSDLEQARIISYLGIKYGISLSNDADGDGTPGETIGSIVEGNYVRGDGTVIWDYATYSAYHNDIAGIGRDDISCLNQKQSRSQSSGSIVTMGLGSIESTNAANSNTFTTDGEFLIWGHDGDDPNQSNANTTNLPGNVTERMERIWRVEETGTVAATTIQFDISNLGYSTDASDFQLIVSNSDDMSLGSLTPASSLVNNVLTFSKVDLTDGQYFTIGTARTSCGPGGVTSDLYVWLRADAGIGSVTDNTSINTWEDQSGNNVDATEATNPPLYKNNSTDNVNFNPTIDFDGTNDRLELGNLTNIKSGATNGGDYTVAAVGIRQDGTEWNFVVGSTGSVLDESFGFGYRNTGTEASLAHWTNLLTISSLDAFDSPNESPFMLFGEYDGSGRIFEETRNGGFIRGTDSNTTDISGTQTSYVGDMVNLGNYNGLIPEVIIYDNDISDLNKQQIYSYLAIKYGITLTNDNDNDATTNEIISGSVREGDYVASDGSTVIWTYSANSTYHNDVAGIGRDDDACFNQKQGTAVGTDDILTVGLGAVAATNSANLNGFDDDRDYLIWGNDNGTTAQATANTSDVPNSIAERMSRVWKVEDSGAVGATELQFDLTDLNYSVVDASAFSLLIGNTATMADASVTTGGTLNGNILSFSGVDLTDGQFFTIGTANATCGPGGVNTGVSLWLRADLDVFSDAGSTAATDGNNVGQWNDQSSPADNGSEVDLSGLSPVEPTFETEEINFNPVLRFTDPNSSNASYIETSSNAVDQDMTLIAVFQTGQTSGTQDDFVNSPALIGASETSSTFDYGLGMENGNLYFNADTDVAFDVESPSTYNDNAPHFVTATRVDLTGAVALYVDSEQVDTGTGTTSDLTGPTSFGIGNHSDGDVDAQYAGDIAEAIVFSSALSSEDRNRVESYLALKYGLTRNGADDGTTGGVDERDYRAGDGDVIWDYDGQTATYYNDIFGIGRDDLSCLNQTQSKSENSDALVTFNLSGGFGTDDSFIISGNDNAAIEDENNTEKPATISSRLNREWRVQETGTVGSISLTYDLSSVTGPSGIGTNNLNLTRLLVDDDGDFTSGATLISPSAVNGATNTVTFNVDFTNGQYYTLGSTESAALPVTLISFTATLEKNEQVRLNWSTVSEVNNAYFTVERSADGSNFEVIGTREGAGSSEQIVFYEFIDKFPLDGLSYYRLKQTDFNGEYEYSEIRRIDINPEPQPESYRFYPNLVDQGESINLEYTTDIEQDAIIIVNALNGVVLGKFEVSLKPSEEHLTLSIHNLPKGLHLIRIRTEDGSISTLKLLVR